MKILWLDDLRDPRYFLGEEKSKGIVWEKNARIGRRILFAQETTNEIEVLHLDNFMGDRTITGETILDKISYKITCRSMENRNEHTYLKNLKTVYLHSSDEAVIQRCLDKHKEKLAQYGVSLEKATYPH